MNIAFSPLLPWSVIGVLALVAAALAIFGLWRRVRGATIRTLALALLLLALANPVVMNEEREALSTVVAVIVDRSQSQQNADRTAMTDQALTELKERLARYPRIEPRIVEAGDDPESDTPSTRLFDALTSALADVPPSRVGGAILLTSRMPGDEFGGYLRTYVELPVGTGVQGAASGIDYVMTYSRKAIAVSRRRRGLPA